MSLLKYLERAKRMDDLIRRKATGNVEEFASKLGISQKRMGAPKSLKSRKCSIKTLREIPSLLANSSAQARQFVKTLRAGVLLTRERQTRTRVPRACLDADH